MTATSDYINEAGSSPALAGFSPRDLLALALRAAQGLGGVALIAFALALWAAPGAAWESDVLLFKLILTGTGCLAGVYLIDASRQTPPAQTEIDTVRRELRQVRLGWGGQREVLQRCAYHELSRVEQNGASLKFWNQSNALLAEVTLNDRRALSSLLSGLRDSGKLV